MIIHMACFLWLLQTSYPLEAKKNHANFSVVLDTPEYKRVTELKTHMSNVSHFPTVFRGLYFKKNACILSENKVWQVLTWLVPTLYL